MGILPYDGSLRLFGWVLRLMTGQCVYSRECSGLWRVSVFIRMGIIVYDGSVGLLGRVLRLMTCQCVYLVGYSAL